MLGPMTYVNYPHCKPLKVQSSINKPTIESMSYAAGSMNYAPRSTSGDLRLEGILVCNGPQVTILRHR
jgi:hypothetical protein